MTEVINVKFRGKGKAYFFAPGDLIINTDDMVIVETSRGMEIAECTCGNHFVSDEKIVPPLRTVLRIATEDDLRIAELRKKREAEAFTICEEKIAKHGLDMKLVEVECSFEGNKILFYFTSDGRVDFRELVKDLAGVFRMRIELRQIGIRDQAKMLGGIGICGREFCCSGFLKTFDSVSTKMAKTQSLSLNPTKISGSCGRLMCCLRYEQDTYEELTAAAPKVGAFVETEEGYGVVQQVSLLRGKVKVKLDKEEDSIKVFDSEDIAVIPGGRPASGEEPPKLLELRERHKESEETEISSPSADIDFIPETEVQKAEPSKAVRAQQQEKKKPRKNTGKTHTELRHPDALQTPYSDSEGNLAEKFGYYDKAEDAGGEYVKSGDKNKYGGAKKRKPPVSKNAPGKKPGQVAKQQLKTKPRKPEGEGSVQSAPKQNAVPVPRPQTEQSAGEAGANKQHKPNKRRYYRPKPKKGE